VAVTNASDRPVSVSLNVGRVDKTLDLSSRETRILRRADLILADRDDGTPTLIRLQHNGNPGDVLAVGGVTDKKTGYSSTLNFTDPDNSMSSELAGAEFRFGDASPKDNLPTGTRFRAPLVLANVGASPANAVVTVDYTVGGKTNNVEIGDVSLSAGEVKQIDLADRLASLGVAGPVDAAGVQIDYDAPPGSVIGRLTSVDSTGRYSFDVPIKDPNGDMYRSSGSYPWRIDGSYASRLYLKNVTSRSLYGMVLLRFDGGQYTLPRVHFDPYQTMAMDLRALIGDRRSKKDLDGHSLPSNLTSGKVLWFEEEGYSLIGRLEIYDASRGMASTFSCYYPCTCNPDWNSPNGDTYNFASSYTIPLGGATTIGTDQTRYDCNNSNLGTFNVTSSSTYSSGNSSIVSVSGSQLTGNAIGSTSITATTSTEYPNPPNCPVAAQANPGSNATVAAYAQITSTAVNPTTINHSTLPTQATVTVQIYHQDTTSLASATVSLQVGTGSSSPSGINVTYDPATQEVDLAGLPPGNVSKTVTVSSPSAAGTVTIQASLASPQSDPAGELTIKDPSPVTAGQATLTTTTN